MPSIPVIQYFRDNDVWTVRALDAVTGALKDLWDRLTGNGQAKPGRVELGPVERGWYAVHFIKHEGHDFLGQFAVHPDGKARWNQTDRVVKASTAFFTSGVRNLETKIDLGQDITGADAFWAGLDVALVAVPAKLLLSGRAVARSGQELNFAARTRLVAPRLLPRGEFFRKLGAYGAAAATLYVVARHPSLLNSVFAELAEADRHQPLGRAARRLVDRDRHHPHGIFLGADPHHDSGDFSPEAASTPGETSLVCAKNPPDPWSPGKSTKHCVPPRPRRTVECSLDLGRSRTTVEVDAAGWTWQGRRYPYLETCKDRTIYYWDGAAFQPVSRYATSLIKLVPTEWGPPTFEIDGIKMLPTAKVSPYEDAGRKVALIEPRGKAILDTCGGLGYFAAWCLQGGAAAGAVLREESRRALAAQPESLVAGGGRRARR